jgi:hypothetical protein
MVGVEVSKRQNIGEVDQDLRDNLERFGSTFQAAAHTGARSTDFDIAYMVVDQQGDIANTIGGVPMYVDVASLPVRFGETKAFLHQVGDRTYRLLAQPVPTKALQPAAMILVGKDVTALMAGVADQDRFNTSLVGVVIAITGIAAFAFAAHRARLRHTPVGLNEALSVGESKTVEFKSTYFWDTSKGKNNDECRLNVLRAIAGFLNADGGTLFIGVAQDDTRHADVCGISGDLNATGGDKDSLRLKLASQIAERIGSPFSRFVSDRIEDIDGKSVWIVDVQPGDEPAWVRWDNRRRYFVREGPRTSELDSESTYRYIKNKWG